MELLSSRFSTMSTLNIALILFALASRIESKSTPVVQTTKGPVQGEILNTIVRSMKYSSFKGIPYGEPPLDQLRFKPPVPKKPWNDVYKTVQEGPNCVQKDFVFENYTGSEDCLYLNIYTPKLKFNAKSDLLPVMVWIYGGTFKAGYGNSSLYGPDLIVEEGVVLVTFNYRLGPLGFLNLDHENATGNMGLKDQNLVLRWVKDNIDKFGGNPDNVTLFGQSAGGVSVDLHGLSEMSRGLFHRSIAMSASPLCPWGFHTPDKAVKQAFTLSEKLGKSTNKAEEVLDLLYKTPAIDIMKIAEGMGSADPPFKPTIENTDIAKDEEKFLTACSYGKYLSGNFNRVPHLTGFTSHETLLFAGSVESIMDVVQFASNVVKTFPKASPIPLPITSSITSKISEGIDKVSDAAMMKLIEETSDVLFVTGIDMKRDLISRKSGYPVYFYRFSYDTYDAYHRQLYHVNLNGTAHGDDFAYPFYQTVANVSLIPNDPTYITRQRMVRMWTNFAKYGNPTPDGSKDELLQGITWPDSDGSDEYLEFGQDLAIKKHPTDGTVDLLEKVNLLILPVQTGCTGEAFKRITEHPIETLKDVGKKIADLPMAHVPSLSLFKL